MEETTYTYAAVAKILDLPESKLRYWAQVGFVGPSVRSTGRMLFSFQDLVSIKAAKELVDRGFGVAEIRKTLDRVRTQLPHVDRPLDRIRVVDRTCDEGDATVALPDQVVGREPGALRAVDVDRVDPLAGYGATGQDHGQRP